MSSPSVDQRFRGQKVLVTGGLGFIGSNLARRLVEAGAEVSLVDSLKEGSRGAWSAGHRRL